MLPVYFMGFGNSSKFSGRIIAQSLLLLPFRPGEHPLIGQGWTLAHEALFYGLFATAILYGKKWGQWLGMLFLVASCALTIVPILGVGVGGPYWVADWLFSPYNLEFLAGCLAAIIARSDLPKAWLRWCLPCGVLLLLLVWTIPSRNPSELLVPDAALTSRMVLLFGLPYFLVTLGAVCWEQSRKIRPPHLLLRLGDATYSVYLTHFVVLSALLPFGIRRLTGRGSVWLVALLLGGSVVSALLGYLVYRWLEKPMLTFLRRMEKSVVGVRSV